MPDLGVRRYNYANGTENSDVPQILMANDGQRGKELRSRSSLEETRAMSDLDRSNSVKVLSIGYALATLINVLITYQNIFLPQEPQALLDYDSDSDSD